MQAWALWERQQEGQAQEQGQQEQEQLWRMTQMVQRTQVCCWLLGALG